MKGKKGTGSRQTAVGRRGRLRTGVGGDENAPHCQVDANGFTTIAELAAAVKACRACPLSATRKNAVPGEGGGRKGIVLVGEAPGAKEDAQGRPFVGQAGKILDGMLKRNGVLREEVFITNVVKCRPPRNRPPKPAEVAACRPYIERQLELLEPAAVCPMGNSATRALLDPKANITNVHGKAVERGGLVFFPLYHPAATLYNRRLLKGLEEDFSSLGKMARARTGAKRRLFSEEG